MAIDNDTSLIIPVPEAAFLQPFRDRHLRRPGVTMPPHITVPAPFKPLHELAKDAYLTLTTICASFPGFAFTLGRLARFNENGVLYLAPEPTGSFMALSKALSAPAPPPLEKHANIVFHLTLARKQPPELDELEAEFTRSYGARLPIRAMALELSLYEKHGERWFKEASFSLGR